MDLDGMTNVACPKPCCGPKEPHDVWYWCKAAFATLFLVLFVMLAIVGAAVVTFGYLMVA
jgi:hypothetical protein